MPSGSPTLERSANHTSPVVIGRTTAIERAVGIYCIVLAIAQVLWLDLRGTNTLIALGPANLQVADLLIPAVPVLLALCFTASRRLPAIVIFYVCAYGLSLGRGLPLFGNAALTAFRNDVAFILLMVLAASGGIDRIGYRTVERIFVAGALIATALSLSRFVMGPNFLITTAGLDIEIADDWNDGRTIGGPSVIIMIVASILMITREFNTNVAWRRHRFNVLSLFLLAMIVASGQRTAALGMLAVLALIVTSRMRGLTWGIVALIPFFLFAIATGIIDLQPASFEGVGQGMGGRSGTFAYRVQIWLAFLRQLPGWSAFDLAFGRPIGPREELYLLGRMWSASLHSAYLGLIPIVGIFGTVVMLGAVLAYFARALVHYLLGARFPGVNSPEIRVYGALVLLFYGVSYEWRGVLGLFVGILFAFLTDRHQSDISTPTRAGPPAAGATSFHRSNP